MEGREAPKMEQPKKNVKFIEMIKLLNPYKNKLLQQLIGCEGVDEIENGP